MPTLGEIIGTSPGDVLGRTRRRMSDEFTTDAENRAEIALANLKLRAMEASQSQQRLEVDLAARKLEDFDKGRSFVKQVVLRAPEEERETVLRRALGILPEETRLMIGELTVESLMRNLTPGESLELITSRWPVEKRALLSPTLQAFLSHYASMLPPTDKNQVISRAGEMPKEVEGTWFSKSLEQRIQSGEVSLDSKPTAVHRVLNLTVRELPPKDITLAHYHAAAAGEFHEARQRAGITLTGTIMEELTAGSLFSELGLQQETPEPAKTRKATFEEWYRAIPQDKRPKLLQPIVLLVKKRYGISAESPEGMLLVEQELRKYYEDLP